MKSKIMHDPYSVMKRIYRANGGCDAFGRCLDCGFATSTGGCSRCWQSYVYEATITLVPAPSTEDDHDT